MKRDTKTAEEIAYQLYQNRIAKGIEGSAETDWQAAQQIVQKLKNRKNPWRTLIDYWETTRIEQGLETLVRDLQNLAIFDLLALLANVTIIVGLFAFISGGEQQRRNTEVYEAWQVITAAYGQTGSGGRIKALEFLNSSPGTPGRRRWWGGVWPAESLAGVDVSKAYLARIQLPEAHLSGANLEEADLSSANLQQANLWEANLQGASLYFVSLQQANLEEANLQQAIFVNTNLKEANLEETNLQQASLLNANLEKANLEGANLQEAILIPMRLHELLSSQGIDLSKASLQEFVNLREANLSNVNLKNARLRAVNLEGARLVNTNLQRANLEDTNLQGAILLKADFTNTQNLELAQLQGE